MVNHWINKLSFGECIREALMGGVTLTMVPQGWTLKQELVLSLVIPVGILLATRHALWLAGTTLFAIACLKLSPFAFHFTLGILIAKHYTQIEEYMTKHRLLRSLVLLVGLLLYTYRYTVPSYLGMSDDALYIWFITGVGSACILVFAIASPHTRSFFSQKWAIYIGRISYSVYLTHMLVLICLTPYVLKLLAWLPPGILWLGGLGFSVGCVVVISEVSYRLVEAPSIALGKKLGAVAQRLRLP
jgi:peptidoglycan/LPS O-acetylase OafA/YrhL